MPPRKRDRYLCPVCKKRCDHQRRIVEFIERTTKESGVPYYVENPETIDNVLILMGWKRW